MSSSRFKHWIFDLLLLALTISLIFFVEYESIIEKPKRDFWGASAIHLLRLIDLIGGKTIVYVFLGIVASLFFANGTRKFIREWRADELQGNEKDSPAQLIKHYQTLCDVLLARGHDDAYNELTRINVGKGTASWAKKVGEALSDLKGNDPVAFKSVAKWAKYFSED